MSMQAISPQDTIMTTHPASINVAAVLSAHAPAAWPWVAPYIDALFYALDNGHSFIYVTAQQATSLQAASPIVGNPGDFTPLILQDRQLFLGRLWQLEQDIAAHMWRLAKAPIENVDWITSAASLKAWFAAGSEGQQIAAALALLQPFMLIKGGPGTGKTTTVAKLLALLCQNYLTHQNLPRIGLAAPTGKAAAHMAQALRVALAKIDLPLPISTHLQALQGQTVHRLLGLYPPQLQSRFHARNPLAFDVLVVDEASMLDLSLLRSLLQSLRSGCRLILLGDENQLPAVGAGDVLGALSQATQVSSELAAQLALLLPQIPFCVNNAAPALAANVATLTVSHRFRDDDGIGCLAQAVVAGESSAALTAFVNFPAQLQWMSQGQDPLPWPLLYQRQAAYWQAVEQHDAVAAFAALKEVMVLAAWRQDAADFNQGYRRYLAQQGHHSHETWFAGQVLMITQNDAGTALYNGDMGIVLPKDGTLVAYFSDGTACRSMGLSRLPEHETAFAITVHKSQGSEYGEVWLLPPSGDEDAVALFDRALLYTAITRARLHFVFWGEPTQLEAAVLRNSPRRSGLYNALCRCAKIGSDTA